jgi:hypothetical protein
MKLTQEIETMNSLDQDLVRVFTLMQQSADRIVCFARLREQFLELLAPYSRQSMSDDALMVKLLQLRKAKKLPALHRGDR